MFYKYERLSNCDWVIFNYLFFVTKRGVPQSITRLYLLFIGSSESLSSCFTDGAAATFFGPGFNNYFFKASILFCFSVFSPSSGLEFYAANASFYWLLLEYGTSFIYYFVAYKWLISLSLQYSNFHKLLTSIFSSYYIY